MPYLLVADTHFTDRPRDSYRFGLFDWLAEQQELHKVDATFFLGDLTDAKDRHSATLVNGIVDGFRRLEPPVCGLMGNHDYIERSSPFFRFVRGLGGCDFFIQPVALNWHSTPLAIIPHFSDQEQFDAAVSSMPNGAGFLLHQTFTGAIAETGGQLTGFSTAAIAAKRPRWAFSGDIHRPQQCGPVTYVGAPYTIRFGDDFEPRVLLLEPSTGQTQDLHFDCPRKWVLKVRDSDEIEADQRLLRGDQVKITIELTREEVVQWQAYKAKVLDACRNLGLDVFGVSLQVRTTARRRVKLGASTGKTTMDMFQAFCREEVVATNIKEIGHQLLS